MSVNKAEAARMISAYHSYLQQIGQRMSIPYHPAKVPEIASFLRGWQALRALACITLVPLLPQI